VARLLLTVRGSEHAATRGFGFSGGGGRSGSTRGRSIFCVGAVRAGNSGWVNGFIRLQTSVRTDACSGRPSRPLPLSRGIDGCDGWPCTAWFRAAAVGSLFDRRSHRPPTDVAAFRARHLCGAPCDARSRRFHRCAPRAASRCSRDGVDALCAGFAHCLGIVAKLGGFALFIIHLVRARRDPHTNTLRTHVLQPATDGRVKRAACSTTRWMGARFVGSSVRSVGGAAGLAWRRYLTISAFRVGLGRLPG